MNSTRLLLADPDVEYRDQLAGYLAQQGFLVSFAITVDQTRKCLQKSWYHLVVLNMQLSDPHNPADMTGLEILQDPSLQPIPKLVIANHPSIAQAREALRPGPTGIPMAVDFLGKDSGIESMLNAIHEAVKKHVSGNENLKIRQAGTTSILQLAQLIEPELSNHQLAERADELESLVRCVFSEARQITIVRLLLQRPGTTIVEVVAHAAEVLTLIVVCSQAGKLKSERAATKTGNNLDWLYAQSSIHFSIQVFGIQYAPPLKSFKDVFSAGSTAQALDAVTNLLSKSFRPWHAVQKNFETPEKFESLAQERLELDPTALESCIPAICQAALANGIAQLEFDDRSLSLHLAPDEVYTYPNPAYFVGRQALSSGSSPILCGLTHGRISSSVILFDANGQSWLIDRERVGIGPVVLDYTALELEVRVESMPGMSLAERFRFEQKGFENDPDENATLEWIKAAKCIRLIRQEAKPGSQDYELGLLYTALAKIATFHLEDEYTADELMIFTHVLILAAMLLEKPIQTDPNPARVDQGLRIDLDSKEVWVEGNRVELTPQDLEILIYLFKNAGQQRSRQQIIDSAMHIEAENLTVSTANEPFEKSILFEESRLNSAMSRLRNKIEPDPENPKYLRTIRGYGYRLDV